METKTFRAKRYWAYELGMGLLAIVCAYLAVAAALGYETFDREMFGSKEVTRWFMVATLPLGALVGAFLWTGSRKGFPRVEVGVGWVIYVNMFGSRKYIDLSAYGPAYLFKDKFHKIDFITFFKAEKEAALKQSGMFAPPTQSSADLHIQLSYITGGKGSPEPQEISEAINSARVHSREGDAISDEMALKMIRHHKMRQRLVFWLMPPLVVALFALEAAMDQKPSVLVIGIAVSAAVVKFFLDYLEDSPNEWVQRIRMAISLATYAILAAMACMVIWWLFRWLTAA